MLLEKSGKRFTYANVASTLALILAVGGSGAAVAAALVPNNSVGSDQIIDQSIKGKDVKPNTLKTGKIKDNSLQSADVKDGSLTGTDVKDGSLTTGDVADNNLTGTDVKDGSLGSADVTDGSLTGTDVADGSLTGTDVADGSIGSGDVTDNSLTTGDIANGTITHGDFTSAPIGIVQGYAWNNLLTPVGTVQLTNSYVYNSAGGAVNIVRNGAGSYTVTFVGLDFDPGNVQVSSYGGGATFCKVVSWGGGAVNVACYVGAVATDSLFSLAVIK